MSQVYNYAFLRRLQKDCEKFLGESKRDINVLYTHDISKQIETMKEIYNTFLEKEGDKPSWISMDDILEYEKKMLPPKEMSDTKFRLFLEEKEYSEEDYINKRPDFSKEYKEFINKYEKQFKKDKSNNSFEDYLKYTILGNKFYNMAKNEVGAKQVYVYHNSLELLNKYDIKKTEELGNLYKRLKEQLENGIRDKVIEKYESLISDLVSEEVQEKYISALAYNSKKTAFDNAYDYENYKLSIARNFEKIEENNNSIKFFVLDTESPVYSKGNCYSFNQIEERFNLAKEEQLKDKEKYGLIGVYNTITLIPICDTGDKMNLFAPNITILLKVGEHETFKEYLKDTLNNGMYEFINQNKDKLVSCSEETEDNEQEK